MTVGIATKTNALTDQLCLPHERRRWPARCQRGLTSLKGYEHYPCACTGFATSALPWRTYRLSWHATIWCSDNAIAGDMPSPAIAVMYVYACQSPDGYLTR